MNFIYSHIIPECNADTNLVQTLLQIQGVNHQKSCGQVTNEMQKRFKDKFAVGVIDLDELQSNYSAECEVIASSDELSVCRHPGTHHYLVKINNVFENFIVNCAKEVQVDFSSLGLPFEKNDLMKRTKKNEAKNDPELTKFFKKLFQATEMGLLKETLQYLNENKYCSTKDGIVMIFQRYGFMLEGK